MKRLHIHLKTKDLTKSVSYYEALLGAPPTISKHDYAQWLIDEPAANISLSTRCSNQEGGIDHVGISLDTEDELNAIAARLEKAGQPTFPEKATTCCYARSNKYWTHGPEKTVWELFQTFDRSHTYHAEGDHSTTSHAANCCA